MAGMAHSNNDYNATIDWSDELIFLDYYTRVKTIPPGSQNWPQQCVLKSYKR